MSEFTQFDSVKSMIRYLPPKGTAGLARTDERIDRRSPSPPARITAIVRFMGPILTSAREAPDDHSVNVPLRTPVSACRRGFRSGNSRTCFAVSPGGNLGSPRRDRLEEQARVDEVALEADRPVEVRPGRMAGVALVADHLAAAHRAAGANRAVRDHVGVPRLELLAVGDDHDPGRI